MSPTDLNADSTQTFESVTPEFETDAIDASSTIAFESAEPEFLEYDLTM